MLRIFGFNAGCASWAAVSPLDLKGTPEDQVEYPEIELGGHAS